MIKLKILSVGKTKEKWLEEALKEYEKRLKPSLQIEWVWLKDEKQLTEQALKESYFICLDVLGLLLSSEELSHFLQDAFQKGGSRLTIVIGGAEGLSTQLKNAAAALISLSPLTLTHQITRLVLIEQIYRSIEIQKGSRYHK